MSLSSPVLNLWTAGNAWIHSQHCSYWCSAATTQGHQCPWCWLNIHWTIFTKKYYIDRENHYKKWHVWITQIKLQHAIYRLYLIGVVKWTNNGTIVEYINFLGLSSEDMATHIARFARPSWGPPGSCCPHVGRMNLAIRASLRVYWSIRSHQQRWGLNQLHYIQLSG